MLTVEKLTLENMGVAFGILSLGSTEPEIHLGGHLPPPIATYVLKNTIATLGLIVTDYVLIFLSTMSKNPMAVNICITTVI